MAEGAASTSRSFTLESVWDCSDQWHYKLSENDVKGLSVFVPPKDQPDCEVNPVTFTYTYKVRTLGGWGPKIEESYTNMMCIDRDWESEQKEVLIYFWNHTTTDDIHNDFAEKLQQLYRIAEKKGVDLDLNQKAILKRAEMGEQGMYRYKNASGEELITVHKKTAEAAKTTKKAFWKR
ncbi:hypothetical protein [Parashewanella tropica]|uniref:hypothetical protein n=1 Tax=Parashewanella tropica TaxID=2547970 RepID=UPI00105A03B5|nr:hypothetical protein [Parashewanella tropica]